MYIEQCVKLTNKIYSQYDSSHDMDHILRVLQNAKEISKDIKGVDHTAIELAVYLHDIDDPKYSERTGMTSSEILREIQVPDKLAAHVLAIIRSVSFSGGNQQPVLTQEAAIVRDADRLDAIGAIGIARAFAFGGAKGRKLYDGEESARSKMSEQEYRSKQTATVTHFYEKLFLLKDLMVTEEGKRLAEERHMFMKLFIAQLRKETGQQL